MRILFDQATPVPLRRYLADHEVVTATELFWDRLANGELLTAAEIAGFELLITTDQNMRYQQNLSSRKIALVVLGKGNWPLIKPHVDRVVAAIRNASVGTYIEVEIP